MQLRIITLFTRQDDKKPEPEEVPSATATARRRSVKDKDKPEVCLSLNANMDINKNHKNTGINKTIIQPMDVDESVSLSKPKTPAKPGQEPEDVSLTHKRPAETKPTVCT